MSPNERVLKAIEEIKKGNMIVMLDDEDRENEGDLVFAATFSSVEKVNFMLKEARGILCTSLTTSIAKQLDLTPMVSQNSSSHETAFTISIDAKDAKTGVSAYERDMTIKLLCDPNAKPSDFARPGHIFPLIAKDGGTLVRTGHTEGSVDLCRLAGLKEVAVICEIVKDDGMMARRPDLDLFCQKYDLHMVYVSDIVNFRMNNESLIRVIAEENVEFLKLNARKYEILDHKQRHHIAYRFGNINAKTAVKFHTIKNDHEFLKEDFFGFMKSVEYLQKNGGILIFLDSSSKDESMMKDFGIGAQILRYFDISEIELLVQNSQKEFVGISGFGLKIIEQINVGE